MPKPRKAQICKSDTPYYHCVSRCVRRAFLCGEDQLTGKSYEHRRGWIVERLHFVASVFAIDLCAYAVMSNHYHLVVHLNSSREWTDHEVVARWLQLFNGPLLIKRFIEGPPLTDAQLNTVHNIIAVWRARLEDLSWFMKCLNEPIARQANAEDNCTGHFWEARFKSQPLRTDEALLACMAYVDLNPIRAGMADTPEDSDYTSLQLRLKIPVNQKLRKALHEHYGDTFAVVPVKPLFSFEQQGEAADSATPTIPSTFSSYAQLVDWTGRQVRADKRGAIPPQLPAIFERLATDVDNWLMDTQYFEEVFLRRFRRSA